MALPSANYPSSLPALVEMGANLGSNPHTSLHDQAAAEVNAIGLELGTAPSGTDADVDARLDRMDGAGTSTAWASFTPSWSNFTVGNATQTARWRLENDDLLVTVSVILGSTSTMSTDPEFTLPNSHTAGVTALGRDAQLIDTTSGIVYGGWGSVSSGATVCVLYHGSTRTSVSATSPFTWATGDSFDLFVRVPA